jgi:hypothetical protein
MWRRHLPHQNRHNPHTFGSENTADTPAISSLRKPERFPFAHPHLTVKNIVGTPTLRAPNPLLFLPAVLDSTKQMAGEIAVPRDQMQAIEESAIGSQCDIAFVRSMKQ